LPILTGLVIGTILFLFLPLMFIGMLSPVLVSALEASGNRPGNSSGSVYFVSTIAGVSSALIYGFWLIPVLEVTKNIYIFVMIALSISLVTAFVFNHKRLKYLVDRKSTRLNSSHVKISYAVFCLKKKKEKKQKVNDKAKHNAG